MKVALIGSGPSLAGAGLAGEIDAADVVLRLHDCAWQVPADHGSRWDWGLIPGPQRRIDFKALARALPARPRNGWMAYCFGPKVAKLPRDCLPPVNVAWWNERLTKLAGRPVVATRGFAMFICATQFFSQGGRQRPTTLVGYGFDAIKSGDRASWAYHPNCDYPVDSGIEERHDMAAEHQAIADLSARTGFPIVLK